MLLRRAFRGTKVTGAVGRADEILGRVKLTRTSENAYLIGTWVNSRREDGLCGALQRSYHARTAAS